MSRWLSPLMAFCLSFIIIAGLAPSLGLQIDRQLDFWLLWLVTLIFLALPVVYLEVGLAKRTQTSALNALLKLTRDADASPRWRVVGWLAVVFIPFLAGGLIYNTASHVVTVVNQSLATPVVFAVVAIIAMALSFVSRQILVLLTTVGSIVALVAANVMGTGLTEWQLTPVEFSEWGKATILALVASGLGLGLYWQSQLGEDSKAPATRSSLPIWIAQLLAVIAFGYFAVTAAVPAYLILIATVAAAALMLNMAREQLAQRSIAPLIQYAVLLVAFVVWIVPEISVILTPALMLWGLTICLIYAVFAGWIMKISHLRKALNFSNELIYNLWRVAVRIVLPISILIAIISFIRQLV